MGRGRRAGALERPGPTQVVVRQGRQAAPGPRKLGSSEAPNLGFDRVVVDHVRNANSRLCLSRGRQRTCGASANDALELRPDRSGGWRAETPDGVLRFERIGNTFRIRDAAGRCLHVRGRSLDEGARVRFAPCPAPGRADFHWELPALREAMMGSGDTGALL